MALNASKLMDDEEELRRKAKKRRDASDEVLENVYDLLIFNTGKKDPDGVPERKFTQDN